MKNKNYLHIQRMSLAVLLAFLLPVCLTGCKKSATDEHGHNHGDQPVHDEANHNPPVLSEQALKNMGVVVVEVDSRSFAVYESVPGVIKETPANERPLYAPFSGRVRSINVVLGEAIKANHLVLELIRDPIPRIELNQVEELLKPVSDEFHTTISELRKIHLDLGIAQKELNRLKAINSEGDGDSLIPQKTLIDLSYDIEKLQQGLSNLRGKLALHGFSKDEIASIERGSDIVMSRNLWLSALKKNGIWDKTAESVFKLLPNEIKDNQWSIATLGELKAEGLLTKDLLQWFSNEPAAAAYIVEIGGLLQQGNSLAAIKDLYSLGAFQSVIAVKAPATSSSWDVEKIHIKVGQHVDTGAELVTLSDHSKMFLMAMPAGSEMAAIAIAAKENRSVSATPLTKGNGPTLEDLTVTKIMGVDGEGTKAIIPVKNTVLSEKTVDGHTYRNWALRNEFRYVLRIPTKTLEDVIVLPSSAIVEQGNDKVIFVKANHGFEERKVVVVYQDDSVAVLGEGSEVFPLDPMVTDGAFALSLALREAGGGSAVDPHAGHDH